MIRSQLGGEICGWNFENGRPWVEKPYFNNEVSVNHHFSSNNSKSSQVELVPIFSFFPNTEVQAPLQNVLSLTPHAPQPIEHTFYKIWSQMS